MPIGARARCRLPPPTIAGANESIMVGHGASLLDGMLQLYSKIEQMF